MTHPLSPLPALLRTAAAFALVLGLAACATAPSTAPSTPPSAPHLATPQKDATPEQQQRQVLISYLQTTLSNDTFFEDVGKMQRSEPNFQAFKQALTAIYSDELVTEWMVQQLIQGRSPQDLPGQVGRQIFNGIGRLNDEQALSWLRTMGGMMKRLSPAQCERLINRNDEGFAAMVKTMAPGEVTLFFAGFHQGWRAELQGLPLRPVPTAEQMKGVAEAFRKIESGPSAAKASSCVMFSRLIDAVDHMPGAQRTAATTMVLSLMSMGARERVKERGL
jgi:hypothetical protein